MRRPAPGPDLCTQVLAKCLTPGVGFRRGRSRQRAATWRRTTPTSAPRWRSSSAGERTLPPASMDLVCHRSCSARRVPLVCQAICLSKTLFVAACAGMQHSGARMPRCWRGSSATWRHWRRRSCRAPRRAPACGARPKYCLRRSCASGPPSARPRMARLTTRCALVACMACSRGGKHSHESGPPSARLRLARSIKTRRFLFGFAPVGWLCSWIVCMWCMHNANLGA